MEETLIQILKNQELIMRYLKLERNYECHSLKVELHNQIIDTKEEIDKLKTKPT